MPPPSLLQSQVLNNEAEQITSSWRDGSGLTFFDLNYHLLKTEIEARNMRNINMHAPRKGVRRQSKPETISLESIIREYLPASE